MVARCGRLAYNISDACVYAEGDEDGKDDESFSLPEWSNDDDVPVARMTDGQKRKRGDAPRKPRFKPMLRDDWRDLAGDMIKNPVGRIYGVSKREVCTQLVLTIRYQLGTKRQKARTYDAVQELNDNGEPMQVGDGEVTEAGCTVHNVSWVRARCTLNIWVVRRVVSDPGSTHSLVERACTAKLNLKTSGRKMPKIELADGQKEPVHAIISPVRVTVEGVSAELVGRALMHGERMIYCWGKIGWLAPIV